MKHNDVKIWFFGLAIVVIANGIWSIMVFAMESSGLVVGVSPAVAAFVIAYLSEHRKIAYGLSMTIVGSVICSLQNYLFSILGYSHDFLGLGGLFLIFIISFVVLFFECLIGAIGGACLAVFESKANGGFIDGQRPAPVEERPPVERPAP